MTIPELHNLFLKHQAISTDTRKLTANSIFFALKGENFNGNTFAVQAIEQGCSYAVVDEEAYAGKHPNIILVNNVLICLQELATWHRQYWGKKIIGLTGSNGKTTTKELLHAVLKQQFNCLATTGNLNNHIGVPLTLLQLKPEHEMAIVEMGANHQGEIDLLCNIVQPQYGIITNIGKAHLEGFGGEVGVLKGKGELYKYIRKTGGTIFINADDEKLTSISSAIKAVTYGYGQNNRVVGKIRDHGIFLVMDITCGGHMIHVNTNLTGKYNGINVLCAYAVGHFFGIAPEKIKTGIESYQPDNNRSQVFQTDKNTLILDAYNANPSSMQLAIENLKDIDAPKKLVVLGDMLEMGEYAANEHANVFNKVKASGLKGVFVGPQFALLGPESGYHFFTNAAEARTWLVQQDFRDYVVLIKGSRGIKLETTVDAF